MMTKNLIANLYNPHEQSKEELIKSFVVRLKNFKTLFQAIKRTEMKAPERHFLIEGQRGMGKTTLLLRLSYEIENDKNLNTWLIPVVLKEEAYYGITRLFKLWETVAKMLADRDSVFAGLFEKMENAYHKNTDYERICFDLVINALVQNAKKIILFIDNVGEMFKNFDNKESYRLREILKSCAQLRIVGATAVTLEASFRHEHAFTEFFHKETLAGLDKAETHNLLLLLAKSYQVENTIQNIINNQPGRVESLRILTGGVIRTVVLLFDIFVDNQNGNAISDLDNVLDRVTPLYKHRMDDLAPLQREVVHEIAVNWDAVNSDHISRKTRLRRDQVCQLLDALEEVFIVQRIPTDTPMHLYYLSERFFNIWYLMRLAPKGSQTKVIWLVRFLESWYDKEELIQRAKKQIHVLSKGDYYPKAAYYITEALAGTAKLDMETEHELITATKKFLAERDKSLLADLSPSDKELYEEGKKYYENKEYEKCFSSFSKTKNDSMKYALLALVYKNLKDYNQAEKYYLMAVELNNVSAMFNLGLLYNDVLKNYTRAEKYYLMAVKSDNVSAMFNLGVLYHIKLKDYSKAEKYYLMAAENAVVSAMFHLGLLYDDKFKNYAQAEKYYLMAAEKEHVDAMNRLGVLYHNELKDYAQAEKYYLMAVEKKHVSAMYNIGLLYKNELKDYTQAEKHYLMAAEKEHVSAIYNLGLLYDEVLKDYTQAEKYYLMAVKKDHVFAMFNLGLLYNRTYKDYKNAEKYYLMALNNGEERYALDNLIELYQNDLKDYAQTEKYYLMAVEKEDVDAMNSLAWFYFEHKRKKEEALKYAIQAVEKDNRAFITHTLACVYLWHNEIDQAISIAKKFMSAEDAFDKEEDIILYLMLLIAKHQYQQAAAYFDAPDLNLKDKFKPLYYALLYFSEDKDYAKRLPELAEPVNDVIEKIKQMGIDYA